MNPTDASSVRTSRLASYLRPGFISRLLRVFAALVVAVGGGIALQVAEPTIASAKSTAIVQIPPIQWFERRMPLLKRPDPHVCVRLLAAQGLGAQRGRADRAGLGCACSSTASARSGRVIWV